MRWHFYATPAADGCSNMALDEALMLRAARTGEAVFRVYGWSSATLSLGRNQRAHGCYDLAAAERAGITFVRRPTGGRALLHHREVTYCVTMPAADASAAKAAYEWIGGVLLEGLNALGVGASRAHSTTALPPGLRPCFDVPSEHEIVVSSRKLVGSAQWRRGGALLQHGSILVHDDQAAILRVMTSPDLMPPPSAATLAAALGREPAPGEVSDAIRAALARAVGSPPCALDVDEALERDAVRFRAVYSSDAWTWRR
jgi:lipoyl(octanoyl) transferase